MDKERKGLEMKQPPERHIRTPWIIRPLLLLAFMLGAASPGCGGNGGDSGTDDGQEDTLEDHDVPVEGQDGDGRDAPEADDAADGDAREDLEEDEGQEAPEPQIAVPCEDGREDIYAALLDDFPPPTAGLRGEIVKCSVERTLSVDDVAQRIEQAGVGDVTAVTGVQLVRITYRTERMGDRPGLGTARAYLPLQSRPGPAPAVVCNHGTIGLADQCAPSNYQFGTALETDTVTDYLTLPGQARTQLAKQVTSILPDPELTIVLSP